MPTLDEILAFLSVVPTTSALIILTFAACVLVTTRDWRLSIFALVLHYALAGLFLARIIRSDIAMVKTLVGMMVCLTLYITARRASEGQAGQPELSAEPDNEAPTRSLALKLHWGLESGWLFRLLVAIMGLVVATTVQARFALPSAPSEVVLACYILFSQGLLALSLADEPLKGGLGILTVLISFDLFYSSIEQSLTVVGLLGLVNFSIALAIAYLTTLQAGVEEGYE